MKRLLSLLFLFLPFCYAASGQEPVRLSLQDCFDYALKHSDTIKNVRLNYRLQKERNDQIQARALPQINGNGGLTIFTNPQQTFLPGEFSGQPVGTFVPVVFTPKYAAQVGINGQQALFDGTLLVALKARNTILELVQQASRLTEEGVKYGIQRSYFNIVVAQQQFRVLTSSLGIARQMLNDAEQTYKAGFIEKIDVTRATVQVNNLETDSIRTIALLQNGEQLLKYQIGMDIYQPIELTDTAMSTQLQRAIEMTESSIDYSSRTEYKLLQTQRLLNEYDIKRYKLAAWPTLSLSGNFGYNYSSNEFRDIVSFGNYLSSSSIGLQLNVPIFNGFLRQHQLKEAKLNLEKTDNNIHFLKQSIDFQKASAQTTLRNALIGLEKSNRNVELSTTVLDLARRKFKAGVGSSIEVNIAQTDLLMSQNNYFQSLLEVINSQADVQRSLGQFQ